MRDTFVFKVAYRPFNYKLGNRREFNTLMQQLRNESDLFKNTELIICSKTDNSLFLRSYPCNFVQGF